MQGSSLVSHTLLQQLEAVCASLPPPVPVMELNPALTKLALRDCALTDEAVAVMMRRCTFLVHLDLSTFRASNLSDEAFEEGRRFSLLEHVNLSGNTRLTNAGVKRLVQGAFVLLLGLFV